MSKQKKFHFVIPGNDVYEELPTTRAAIFNAVNLSQVFHVELYRVLDDDDEQLLFDSKKCQARTIDGILKWAEKGGRP